MKRLPVLAVLLAIQTIVLLVYTVRSFELEGAGLLQIFISNIASFGWNGQFNLDFSCYLVLSGLWIMWRDRFSVKSILTGAAASIIGIIFFAPYLLYLLSTLDGNLRTVLLGKNS